MPNRGLNISCGCNCCAVEDSLPCTEGCCKCPTTGSLSFDILDCQAYHVVTNPIDGMDNWAPIDSCCDQMSFSLTKSLGYEMCTTSGHQPSTIDGADGSSCLTTGTGAGQPSGTGTGILPELWGFSGTVCGDCETVEPRTGLHLDPHSGWSTGTFAAKQCEGMCVRASLCCCVSPTSGASIGGGARCGGGANLPGRNKNCRCAVGCYKFTMEPFDCHDIDYSVICPPRTGTFKSACSPCSYLQGPVRTGIVGGLPPLPSYTGCEWDCDTSANQTGSTAGGWEIYAGCPPQVARGARQCGVYPHTGSALCSGQCPTTGAGGQFGKEMMLIVDGIYRSQCDCATGIHEFMCGADSIYGMSGVGIMRPVFVKFTGLLSSSHT